MLRPAQCRSEADERRVPEGVDAASPAEFVTAGIEVEHVRLAGQKREIRSEALREVNATEVSARLVLDRKAHRRIVGNGRAPDAARRRANIVFAVHVKSEAVPQPELASVDIEA